MRYSDGWHTPNRGLARGRKRPRVVDVCPKVPSGVDPRENPPHIGFECEETQADAIDRRAIDRQVVLVVSDDPDRSMGRGLMPAAGHRTAGSDHPAAPQPFRRPVKGLDAGGIEAIIIGQEKPWLVAVGHPSRVESKSCKVAFDDSVEGKRRVDDSERWSRKSQNRRRLIEIAA